MARLFSQKKSVSSMASLVVSMLTTLTFPHYGTAGGNTMALLYFPVCILVDDIQHSIHAFGLMVEFLQTRM